MNYSILTDQLISLIDPELPFISNLSNLLACLHNELPSLNWTGIYYYSNSSETLYLGPFQGKPACTIIPLGKGVVGTCAQKKKSIIVQNVHTFPGHIACDSASKSEFTAPIFKNDKLYAVLDIDSDIYSRFTEQDIQFLKKTASLLSDLISSAKQEISWFPKSA